jgi:hypothetical protein
MKSFPIVLTCVATGVLSTVAAMVAAPARTSGIYVSAADYTARRLSFEGDCKSASHRLDLHNIVRKPYIDVTHGAETRRVAKSDFYGFRACDGREYRFVDNREYEIREPGPIALYTIRVPGRVSRLVYVFSVGPGGTVLPLTKDALKQAFPDNHAFHDALDQMFHADRDLTQYDTFHKMFKVNRLLIASTSTDR